MAATSSIYRSSTSPTRFQQPFATGPTHYTTTVESMHHMRYNSFAIDGHQVPLPSTTSPTRSSSPQHNMMGMRLPPGATLGLFGSSSSSSSSTITSSNKPLYIPPPPQDQPPQYMQHHAAAASSSAMRHSSPIYSSAPTPLFLNPMLAKSYQQHIERHHHMNMAQQHSAELLLVSPGMPTPLELSIYEIKQPTGLLHVTAGNQTVEFLDGVANMPHKR